MKWLETDFGPLTDAYSKVCLVGSQGAIDVANRIQTACSDLIGAAMATDAEQSLLARLIRSERPTPEQVQAFETAQTHVYKQLEALVVLARREIGNKSVILPLDRAELEAARSDDEVN